MNVSCAIFRVYIKYIMYGFLLVLIMCFYSCRIDEDYNLECIGNVKASLPSHQFKTGLINQYYSDEIKASVDNEPHDDYYDYFFKVDGRIPEGIEIEFDYRTVSFHGIPSQTGRFKFKVFLEIDPYYPESAVCIEYNTSKEYEMIITSN